MTQKVTQKALFLFPDICFLLTLCSVSSTPRAEKAFILMNSLETVNSTLRCVWKDLSLSDSSHASVERPWIGCSESATEGQNDGHIHSCCSILWTSCLVCCWIKFTLLYNVFKHVHFNCYLNFVQCLNINCFQCKFENIIFTTMRTIVSDQTDSL